MTYLERPTQSIQLMPLFLALAMATAFALLAWYVFAPQCISTLSIVKRSLDVLEERKPAAAEA